MRFETIAVRGSEPTGRGEKAGRTEKGRPHALPIDLSTTYTFRTSEAVAASMDHLIGGGRGADNPVYARLQNPTVEAFERSLAALEEAEDAVAFGSGMAAISALLLAAAAPDPENEGVGLRHVVAIRPVYGGTDHLLASSLLGTEVTWVEPSAVEGAIRIDTGLVLLETPANPTLEMVDIRSVVEAARAGAARLGRRHVPVAVDSTFATPVLQRPLTMGADLVVHSATKFLGGHGDVMGGVVACDDSWARKLRQVRMATGAVLHPMGAYMLHRGLKTLPVRVLAQQDNARILAERLLDHTAVAEVFYPGLHGDAEELGLLRSQQPGGPGSVLAFRVHGGEPRCRAMLESLRLIERAVSLGSVDTLIQAPALLTHRVVDPSAREQVGVTDDLLRLSVGLEAVEDLWADLDQALAISEMESLAHAAV